ncbi:MAG TPA: DUF1501 domain-containing protein [Pirellulales bacterium]|nr:DUF1501 domain-containing protein [Pirellulales bacterium]
MDPARLQSYRDDHAFSNLNPRLREGLVVSSRRSVLKASLAGLAGLSLPTLLRARAQAAADGRPISHTKSVILLWMTGGPSHIDTWDVKPDAPSEIRGPFGSIETKLPGVRLCEYLPKQAALLDKMTIIRSVDARMSNHEPNQVFQTGNLDAEPRINNEAERYPAIASIVARQRGEANRAMPSSVVLNMQSRSHVAWGGYLGKQFDPFLGNQAGRLFQLPGGLDQDRIHSRHSLVRQFDRLRRDLDLGGSMDAMDRFEQQAVDIVAGQQAQRVFDLANEPAAIRERYGSHTWCQQALLARRLVEAGVSFVTIDLSNHSSSGTWDTHGDNIPPYGGIWNGLRPLLPVFDHLLTTLVSDLEARGLLNDVLVLAMGEFGRTPKLGTQGSTDGRDHWPVVMSMTMAGGGFRHGQVIGASERDGGQIKARPVTPGDLAATIYHHMGVPLDGTYLDSRGRPRFYVEHGEPIRELL